MRLFALLRIEKAGGYVESYECVDLFESADEARKIVELLVEREGDCSGQHCYAVAELTNPVDTPWPEAITSVSQHALAWHALAR